MNKIENPNEVFKALKWVMRAVSRDMTRYTISRLFVDDGKAIATDGHRLHWVGGIGLPQGFSLRAGEWDCILALSVQLNLTEIEYDSTSTRWVFTGGPSRGELVFSASMDRFVDYARVIPSSDGAREAPVKDLRKAYVREGVADYCVIGEAWCNAKYVADALVGAPKTVKVCSAGDADPCLFLYANRGAVVMPLRKP